MPCLKAVQRPFTVLWKRRSAQEKRFALDEAQAVFQLYQSFAAARWQSNHPGDILCGCWRDGDCGPATGWADGQYGADEQYPRTQRWRCLGLLWDELLQRQRPPIF